MLINKLSRLLLGLKNVEPHCALAIKKYHNQTQFQLGYAPIRRTWKYLKAGKLVFKDNVRIMTINYNTDEFLEEKSKFHPVMAPLFKGQPWLVRAGDNHKGAQDFVVWNLPQIQYLNPEVQVVALKNMTPTPFITCYMDDGEKVLFDVDGQSNKEIEARLVKILGKTQETLAAEEKAAEKMDTPAHFGEHFDRLCICSQPGQVHCPSVVALPKIWTGKYHYKWAEMEDEEVEQIEEAKKNFSWKKVEENAKKRPNLPHTWASKD